jgi:Na+/H+ antiporter NhaD/arsenite permease-like protein
MLISVESGVPAPFLSFVFFLLPSTLLNLLAVAGTVYLFYRKDLTALDPGVVDGMPAADRTLARQSRLALAVAVGGMVLTNVLTLAGAGLDIGISEVTLLAATLLLAASGRRDELVARVDWGILVMFAGLFVFTKGVYNGGLVELVSPAFGGLGGASLLLFIVASSILLSQVVSNVPLVTLLIPLYSQIIPGSSPVFWVAFAGGSTLAGNVSLLGAASNLIVVEQAEKEGEGLGYLEFSRTGIPVSAVSAVFLLLTLLPYVR